MRTPTNTRPKRQTSESAALQLARETQPSVDWPDYLRLVPGVYPAYCKKARWYWDNRFKRWTCILLFDVFASDLGTSLGTIPMWFNGGNGKTPKAGRCMLYFPAWVRANGAPPPRKDRLSPKVFEDRMAKLLVGDTKGDAPYSVGRKILEWSTDRKSVV